MGDRLATASGAKRIGVLGVHTAHRPPLGADTKVHVQILASLDRRQCDVHVACVPGPPGAPTPTMRAVEQAMRDDSPYTLIPVDFGVEDVDWHTGPRSATSVFSAATMPWHVLRLIRHVRRHRIEIVHTSDRPRDAVAAVLVSRFTRARSIVHVHTEFAPWMSRLLRGAMARADLLVGVSDYVASTLVAGGLDPEKVRSIPNAIDVGGWQPGVGREATRAEFGLGPEDPLLLTVCRLIPGKGTIELVRACADVRRRHPTLQLVIAGLDESPGQEYGRELAALITELGLEDAVHLLGRRDDVPALMAAADVFALPSWAEPFGLVFLEAMAMAVPVVALASGGAVEVVEHERSGLLSPPGDHDALVANIDRLVSEPDTRRRLGRHGRTVVTERFTLETQARRVQALYGELLSGPSEPEGRRGGAASKEEPMSASPQSVAVSRPSPDADPGDVAEVARRLDEDGYVVFRGIADPDRLADLATDLAAEYERVVGSGELFEGGGRLSGHLNCSPGVGSRFVWSDLEDAGIVDLVRKIRPDIADRVRVTLNWNLPGSVAQHYHADGLYVEDFLICNVAVVDTDLENGALDILPGTNREFHPFWRYATRRLYRGTTRVPARAGDVILRRSTTWHRGMPNRTDVPRPMLAVTFGETAAPPADPWSVNGGRIEFTPNWYSTSRVGRIRERVSVASPHVYSMYRFARSLYGTKGYDTW